jgi:hypothetical protein
MTVTIATEHFKGGKHLADEGDTTDSLTNALRAIVTAITAMKQPSLSAPAVAAVGTGDIAAVTEPAVSATGGVVDGLITGAPTTPSSQAVDPGGFTTWNVNVSAGYGFVNSVGKYNAAQVDLAISTGAKIMTIGQAMYAWLVWKEAGGTVTQQVVLGTAAALGAETIPDDAAITAAVTHARWAKLALCHASRTADAVVATTQDTSLMLKWGGSGGALINELRTIMGTVRTLLNEVKTRAGEVRTLVNEARTDLMAQSAVTLGIVNG